MNEFLKIARLLPGRWGGMKFANGLTIQTSPIEQLTELLSRLIPNGNPFRELGSFVVWLGGSTDSSLTKRVNIRNSSLTPRVTI